VRRIVLVIGLLLAALPTLSTAAQGCGLSPIRSGLTVRVTAGVNLRAAPGLNARDIGGLRVGDIVTLIGGPACASNIKWWQIGGATPGWIAEATETVSYMEAAPVTPADLRGPLDGLTVDLVSATTTPPNPVDQCPPANGGISVNYAGVTDPFTSGSEAALFVEGGYGTPRPALCVPAAQVSTVQLTAPNALVSPAQIVPIPDVTDYVRATLPESALLLPGVWRLAAGDFTLDVRVIGPFGPLVDVRTIDTSTQTILAGFAPNEQVALLGGDIADGAVSNLRVVTLTTDAQGVAGANLDGAVSPVIAAVSQSGLIALPPNIQSLGLEGAANRTAVYDSLVIALWGFEALGLPTPAPAPPTSTPEPATETPVPTPTLAPTATVESTTTAALATPAATATGIVNLGGTPTTLTPPPSVVDTSDGCTYIVKSGDTFFKIALANGVTTAQLREANPQITDTWLIFAGTVLNIPGCGKGMP
jgi:LysM repeat protein